MSKIIFLGTAGDSVVAGKQIRESGGLIVQTGEIQLHIDPGPGAVVGSIKNGINPRANTAVLVSNSNLLNSNDVNAVIDAMTYGGEDKTGVLVANNTLVNGEGELNPYLTKFYEGCLERVIILDKGKKLGIEDVEIHAMPALNSDPNAMGFKIFTSEFVLGYSSDTKYSKDVAEAYKGSDILVLNVSLPSGEKSENSMNSDDAVKFIELVKPNLAIITHFGIKMIKSDPLYEGREIQKKTDVQILAAKDGMTLQPDSYDAESKQKRLKLTKNLETGAVKPVKEEHLIKEEKKEEIKEQEIKEEEKEQQKELNF